MIDRIYITGLFIPAYVVGYVPFSILVMWVVHLLLLRHLPIAWLRGVAAFALLGAILTAPLWDVYSIGKEAEKLCREQAGLHVFKTVEAEGFRGGGIEFWSKFGFNYMEGLGRGGKKYRYTMRAGKEVAEVIPEFTGTRYDIQTGHDFRVLSKHFSLESARVIDLQTKEILSELVTLSIYPGWLDQLLLWLTGTGSGFTPWMCGNEPPLGRKDRLGSSDLGLATIKPVKTVNKGETK